MSESRKSHRRDFLRGRSAVDAVQEMVDQLPEGEPRGDTSSATAQSSYVVRYTRRAMACDFEMLLNAGQYSQGAEAALAALDLVDQLESQLSSYRAQSEICHLNRVAGQGVVVVEPRLLDLLARAVDWSRQTDGAYDVTSGPLSRVWGFMRRAGAIPDPAQLAEALERVGSQHLQINRESGTIRFALPQMELNLGGIGKGYALDRCAELLANAGVDDYLIHGGNSSLLAHGSHSISPNQGWRVGARDPLRPHHRLCELWLIDRAISTSSAGLQHFVHNGRQYGHLIDPRTGWPAQGVLSVTVLASTAAEAEAFSTAFYVLGAGETAKICQQRPDLGVLLITPGRFAGSLVAHRHNVPDEIFATALPENIEAH